MQCVQNLCAEFQLIRPEKAIAICRVQGCQDTIGYLTFYAVVSPMADSFHYFRQEQCEKPAHGLEI